MTRLTVEIPGRPCGMGSKRIGRTRDGRPLILDAKDGPLRSWQESVRVACWGVRPAELLMGPVVLRATFYLQRPAGHYGTGRNAGRLKSSAPEWCATKPDCDKLCRALGDVLTGLWYRDDGQVARIEAEKRYADGPERTVLTVEKLEETR